MATACYIANYLPGSFKGVPMECLDATSEHGRRGATGEFPFGEDTAYADLGRRIRKYSLKVRFAENSHVADAEALIAACESPGSGPLVHPTRGLLQAACSSIKVRDDLIEEQGVTYADLEMIEANDWPAGLSLGDSFVILDIIDVIEVASDLFLNVYLPLSAAFHRRDQIFSTASSQIFTIADEYKKAKTGSTDRNVPLVIADLERIAGDKVLLSDPALVNKAITRGIGAVALAASGDAKFQAMRRIANAAAQSSRLSGGAAAMEDAVFALVRITSGAYLAQAGLETNFSTVAQALEYYDIASVVLKAEADTAYITCNNVLFIELRRFIISFQSMLLARAYKLPSLVQYKFHGSYHPLVAAYSIFGDAKRHRELEASNALNASGRFAPSVIGTSRV